VVAVTAANAGGTGEAQGDEIMRRIGEAIAVSQQGERSEARATFAQIWAQISEGGDPLHRCVLAHFMADVQDDPRQELVWDLRALDAANSVTDERTAAAGASLPVGGFYPSLHLNLGEDYRKLGDMAQARHHLDLGRRAAPFLGDDPYSSMIRRGLEGLARRLSE
jgi:hypothetical protein